MENYRREWTEQDFDSLSWHDNELHGIRLRNPSEEEQFDLVLDIDHILSWTEHPDGTFTFVVAPALLTFHQVTNLECRFALLHKEHLTISRIDRENPPSAPGTSDQLRSPNWRVHLQPDASPRGVISFEATGFIQRLTKEAIQTSSQSLEDDQR